MDLTRPDRIERLLSALVWIETHLDGDLSLGSLAAVAGLSPHHFHRLFRACIGETAKRYVQRLRLERGAYLLSIEERTVLDVALDVGFHSHATFTRAFRRLFGAAPGEFRGRWRSEAVVGGSGRQDGIDTGRQVGELSATRVRKLRDLEVAFIRHHGDYELVPPDLWNEILEWTRRTGRDDARLLLGIGHDAPSITPADKLRFDACVRVSKPFSPQGRIGCQTIPGGYYATTSHVGPFDTLSAAWAEVFRRVEALPGCHSPRLPAIEVYQSTEITPEHSLNRTELWMPLDRPGG